MHPYPRQNTTFTDLSEGCEVLFAAPHRFSFNGKESDSEVKGEGNQQDYGFRIYDPRKAKFLSVDPLTKDYPWYTPYQFAGNKPIKFTDLDGLEECPAGQDYSVKKNENRTPGEVVGDFISGVLGDLEAVNDYFSNPETKVGVVEAIVASLNLSVLFIAPESTELKAARTTNTVRRAESVVVKVEKAEQVVVKTNTNTTTSVSQNAKLKITEKLPSKSSPNFKTPIHPPQAPPKNAPEGMTIRIMKPTEQYPYGYWRLEKPQTQGGAQGINPATLKPGSQHETHVPLPEGYWNK